MAVFFRALVTFMRGFVGVSVSVCVCPVYNPVPFLPVEIRL